jgi:hypothetical protein
MSQENYAALQFRANLERDPELMSLDLDTFEQTLKEKRASEATLNPIKPVSQWEEFRQLRGTLHTLEQDAANSAIYFTNIAGNVALIEKNIKTAEQDKRNTFKAGNFRGEKTYENTLSRFEDELVDAQTELKRAKANKEACAKAFATFDQHERIAELQKHFDSLNPNI